VLPFFKERLIMEASGIKHILSYVLGGLAWLVIGGAAYVYYVTHPSKPESKSDTPNPDQEYRHDYRIWEGNRGNYVPGNVGQ